MVRRDVGEGEETKRKTEEKGEEEKEEETKKAPGS